MDTITAAELRWLEADARKSNGRSTAYSNGLARAADALERLERARDVLAKAYDGERTASAQYRAIAGDKSREAVEEFLRAEAAEAELATLRARVAKMEEAVKALSQPKALTEAMEFTGLSAETLLAVRDYINKRYAVGPKP